MSSVHQFQLLLFVHLVAVMIWVGGALVGTLIGMRLRRAGDTRSMASFCAAFAEVAGPVFGGSGLLVLLTGIGMVAMDGGPEFDALWVTIGFVGWLVSLVLGAAVVGRKWFVVGQRLGEDGATIEGLAPQLRSAVTWTWVDLAVRFAVIAVMVWRPT